jgi:diadenosine tetraphosphate (Ap4A) HIT family hydrolase
MIYEERGWIVEHCVGPLGLGALIVKPRRHIVHVAELDDAEAGALGTLLRDAARVITALCEPDQVYVALWSHADGVPVHIHYVVMPVTGKLVAAHGGARGPSLQAALFAVGKTSTLEDVESFCTEARAAWPTERL